MSLHIHIQQFRTDSLGEIQRNEIRQLNEEAFGDVSKEEAEENFFAVPFASLIAYHDTQAIGTLKLFQRDREFSGLHFSLGGIGGVCVTKNFRGQGVGKQLVQNALQILSEEECDVVCLNADLEKTAYKLYEKCGFTLMQRDASFENSKGKTLFDSGTLLAPIRSQALYEFIMNSDETFHYGAGYW